MQLAACVYTVHACVCMCTVCVYLYNYSDPEGEILAKMTEVKGHSQLNESTQN